MLNAAAGYWTIGVGCRKPYTALTGNTDTFGEGLLEVLVQSQVTAQPTLLVAYDIEARGPLATMQPSRGNRRRRTRVDANPILPTRWREFVGELWQARSGRRPAHTMRNCVRGNAMASCLPFFEAIAMSESRMIHVGLSPTYLLELELDF